MFRRRILLLMVLGLIFTTFSAVYAGDEADDMMAASTLVGLSKLFSDNFSASETLGKPVSAGEYVIIPVVCKVAGFGFGGKSEDKEQAKVSSKKSNKGDKEEQRFGLGSGFMLKPVALIIVKQGGNFEIVKLDPGFFAQLAKHMSKSMSGMLKNVLVKLFKMRKEKRKEKMRKLKRKKRATKRPGKNLSPGMRRGPGSRPGHPVPPQHRPQHGGRPPFNP